VKLFQNFNSKLFLVVTTFLYINFAEQFAGEFNVLEVDYDSYAIVKHCPYNSSQSK